jgi:hypothetical protein
MTQEEKELLMKDLCARLPYGVITRSEFEEYEDGKCVVHYTDLPLVRKNSDGWDIITLLSYGIVKYKMKPYLRPMSSMTEEEKMEFHKILVKSQDCSYENNESATTILNDWYLSKGFDVRGLIPKGLALEAAEGMYK